MAVPSVRSERQYRSAAPKQRRMRRQGRPPASRDDVGADRAAAARSTLWIRQGETHGRPSLRRDRDHDPDALGGAHVQQDDRCTRGTISGRPGVCRRAYRSTGGAPPVALKRAPPAGLQPAFHVGSLSAAPGSGQPCCGECDREPRRRSGPMRTTGASPLGSSARSRSR
jgi:hypothetical protein